MLMSNPFAWLLLLPVGIGAPRISTNPESTPCADLHMIVVRAPMERPGFGILGNLAKAVMANVNGSTGEAIEYPALLQPYDESSYAGVVATTKQLQSHVDRCPNGKVILMGYSQVCPALLPTAQVASLTFDAGCSCYWRRDVWRRCWSCY